MRKYVSNFELELALSTADQGVIAVSTRGALYPIAKGEAALGRTVNSFCPTHGAKEPVRIKSQYICLEDPTHGPFTGDECLKGREVDGTVVVVDKDVVDAAKESSLPKNVLTLRAFEHGDVSERVYPHGTAYFFEPDRVDDAYTVISSVVKQYAGKYMFVNNCNIRNVEKLVGLLSFGDGFIIQQLTYPEFLNEFEAPSVKVNKEVVKHIGTLLAATITPFDPDEFKDDTRDRINDALSTSPGAPVKKAAKKLPAGQDLLSMITAAKAAS
jgi:non-homologous end joining protein Ku